MMHMVRASIVVTGFWCLATIAVLPLSAANCLTTGSADPTVKTASMVQIGIVTEELSTNSVKDIPLGAAGLLSRSYVMSHLTAEEGQSVHNKTQGQIRKEHPAIHAKFHRYAGIWFDSWRHANQVPATPRQVREIQKADKTLKQFFASLGLPYKPLEVVFIPNNLCPGSLAGACDPLYSEAVFLPAEDWNDSMDIALIHEGIHFNSRSPWPLRLEEGIVEMMTEHLVFVNGSVYACSVYAPERAAVDCIVSQLRKQSHQTRAAAERMLATAFLTDDVSMVENILGNLTWQRIVCLADAFECYQSDAALWKGYVKGVKSIRAPVVAAMLNPKAKDSVFVAYASVRQAGEAQQRGQ